MSFFEIVPPGTRFRFVDRWRVAAAASLLALGVCAVGLAVRGPKLGVDFAGGYQLVVRVPEASQGVAGTETAIREALGARGLEVASVTTFGSPEEHLYRAQFLAPGDASPRSLVPELEAGLAERLGSAGVEKVDYVGPRTGAELRASAIRSMLIAFALITVYVGFRFTPSYAPGALVALVHDVALTAGAFVLLGWEFDLTLVAALLTIVGYSLNDTIVIYDRIRENRQSRGDQDLPAVIDRSINETLSRTILTSGTTLLAVLALLILAGPDLRGFAAAMTIGIGVGTYSSVYVASPILLGIERWRARARRPAATGRSGGGRRRASSAGRG